MKPTLYEALGLSPTAGDSEIKAALRRLVRRYYGKTRAGHADVEEALRFLNHASHILGDPVRRSQYDAELAEGTRTESTLTAAGEPSEVAARLMASTAQSEAGMSITDLGLPRDKPPTVAVELAPQWSVQLAELRRTRAGQLGGLLIASFIFLLVWKLAVPSGSALAVIRFAVIASAVTGMLAAAAFFLVRMLSRSVWHLAAPEGPVTVVEGMIPRWRRDRTVFLGTGAPLEDATWLFRLRMAELKRVSAERVSDPRPTMRLLARIFDYALWSIALFGVLAALRPSGTGPAPLIDLLAHPAVAPIWITATWIPVEAFLLARAQTTPGRWLMCVYLHYQVSNPYSPEEVRFTFGGALRRAYEVWWHGCAGWLPFVAFVTMARAGQQLRRSGETSWDSRRDCMVTHGPVGTLSLVTLGIGLAACALALSAQWNESAQSWRWFDGSLTLKRQDDSAAASPAATAAKTLTQPRVSRIDDVAAVREAPPPAPAPAPAAVPAPTVGPTAGSASAPAPGKAAVATAPAALSVREPAVTAREPAAVKAPAEQAAATTSPAAKSVRPEQAKAAAATSAEASGADQPTSMELLNKRVSVYARQAQRQQAAGDYAGLARTCGRWADEDWRNPRAFYCAGVGLQGIGQHRQAIEMFNQANALLPKDDPLKTLIADGVVRSFRAESQR